MLDTHSTRLNRFPMHISWVLSPHPVLFASLPRTFLSSLLEAVSVLPRGEAAAMGTAWVLFSSLHRDLGAVSRQKASVAQGSFHSFSFSRIQLFVADCACRRTFASCVLLRFLTAGEHAWSLPRWETEVPLVIKLSDISCTNMPHGCRPPFLLLLLMLDG